MLNKTLFIGLLVASCTATAAETWVAVGYGGRRMISSDGRTWEITAEWAEKGGDDSNNLMSVAYGNGKFVATGGGGFSRDKQAGHILISTNGRHWRQVLKAPNRVNPVVFGDGQFIAGGPGRTLLWSTDGESWHQGAQIPADGFPGYAMWFRRGAYGNGTFVFMGEGGVKKEFYWCVTTKNGETAEFRRDLPHLRALTFGNGTFVAVGQGVIVTSSNGQEWTRQERPADEKLDWVHWTGMEFLGGGGKVVLRSEDGKSWVPHSSNPLGKVLWTDGNRFIATSWPGKMSYSPDGQQWLRGVEMTPNGINAVVVGKP